MSTEFLFIFVLKISSDMTATLAATPHMSKAVDRQAGNIQCQVFHWEEAMQESTNLMTKNDETKLEK